MPGWQLSVDNSTWVVVFLLPFSVWNEELCPVASFLLRSFYSFQKFEFSSIFSAWGLNSPPPLHWKGQSLYSQGLFLEAVLGWGGIGHLLGSLPFPNLSRGCPAPGLRELQLRVTASEPLSQVGHCAFFRLKSSLKPRGAVLSALGKADFPPFLLSPQLLDLGMQPHGCCHLSRKGQCDSGSLKLQNQNYLGKLSGVWLFRTWSHLCCL